MHVLEHLEKAERPLISFEIIPPLRGKRLSDLENTIQTLAGYNPPFIDITSHSAEVVYEESSDGIKKKIKRKRPGTLSLCNLILYKYGIDSVPHVLCEGFSREETEDFLIELQYSGIHNLLALTGDSHFNKPLSEGKTRNERARDLVEQVVSMNNGVYLHDLMDAEPTNFCIGVAGYPEKHIEAPNLTTDINFLKQKVDAGAHYIVTQMFFDNKHYFEFVDKCRDVGITVPIIPGLKVLTSKAQLTKLPKMFNVEIPYDLSQEVYEADKNQVLELGIDWTVKQAEELMNKGVPCVHFYVMGNSGPIEKVMKKLG